MSEDFDSIVYGINAADLLDLEVFFLEMTEARMLHPADFTAAVRRFKRVANDVGVPSLPFETQALWRWRNSFQEAVREIDNPTPRLGRRRAA